MRKMRALVTLQARIDASLLIDPTEPGMPVNGQKRSAGGVSANVAMAKKTTASTAPVNGLRVSLRENRRKRFAESLGEERAVDDD